MKVKMYMVIKLPNEALKNRNLYLYTISKKYKIIYNFLLLRFET